MRCAGISAYDVQMVRIVFIASAKRFVSLSLKVSLTARLLLTLTLDLRAVAFSYKHGKAVPPKACPDSGYDGSPQLHV